jgi:hypothetical protein
MICDSLLMLNQPTTNKSELLTERAALIARRKWMGENLEGCDWCCGGGDEEAEEIAKRLAEIEAELARA